MAPRKSSSSQKDTAGSEETPTRVLEDQSPPEKALPKEEGGAGRKRSAKSSEQPPPAPDAQPVEKKQRKASQGKRQRTDPATATEGTVSEPLGEDKASVEALEAPSAEQKLVAEEVEASSLGAEAAKEVAACEEEAPAPSDGNQEDEEEDAEEVGEEQSPCEGGEGEAGAEDAPPGEGAAVSSEKAGGETPSAEQKEAPYKSSPRGSSRGEHKGSDDRFSFVTKEGVQNLFQGAKKPQAEECREILGSTEHSEQEGSDDLSSGSLKAVPAPPAERPKSPPKRAKAFYCKFSQTNAFKSFFENLGNVLTEVSLEIRKEGNFAGIMADSMDASRVTLVQGKVSGEVKLNVPPEKAIFCVTVKDFLDIFPNVHPQHFIELYRFEDSTDICLRIFEPSMKTTNICINIQTLDKSIDTVELNEMDYSFYVDVELNSFKNALKTAKNQGAESIQFLIYEVEKMSDYREGAPPSKTMYFVIRYKGIRTAFSFPYESKVVSSACEEGAVHLKAIDQETEESPDDSSDEGSSVNERLQDLKPLYQGTFLSRCLINFIKSMERSNLTLRLANEKPLIIDYPLGCSSTDGLRFVLAPTCPE